MYECGLGSFLVRSTSVQIYVQQEMHLLQIQIWVLKKFKLFSGLDVQTPFTTSCVVSFAW